MAEENSTFRQLVSYGAIGILSNLAGYLLYLAVTRAGVEPKLAVTFLYAIGACLSFLGNRKITFRHEGRIDRSAVRFAMTHIAGYLMNLSILQVFSDSLGYPHQAVQLVAIFVVAGFLFVAFKTFVYKEPN